MFVDGIMRKDGSCWTVAHGMRQATANASRIAWGVDDEKVFFNGEDCGKTAW